MSVSPLVSNPLIDPSTLLASNSHRKDLQTLADALQSGDMTAAQKAFAQMLKDSPRLAQAVNGTQTASSNSRTADFQALATALKSGDLPGAQQAMAKLLQDGPRASKGHSTYQALAGASGLLATPAETGDTATAEGGIDETSTVGTVINAVA
jgi:DNA-binding FadR family transcriptional regulator